MMVMMMLVTVIVVAIEEVIQAHSLLSAIQNPESKSLVRMHLVGGCLLCYIPLSVQIHVSLQKWECVERSVLPQASLRVLRAHSMYTVFPSTI